MSNNQTIQQTLPPVSDNRIIILELIQEPGAANYKAIISPAAGESIDGANTPITVTSNGIAGIFFAYSERKIRGILFRGIKLLIAA